VAEAVAAEAGSASEIADRLGYDRHLVARLLAELEQSNEVKRAGMTIVAAGRMEHIWEVRR